MTATTPVPLQVKAGEDGDWLDTTVAACSIENGEDCEACQ